MSGKQKAPQLDRFRETARHLGCDEDEAMFDQKLKGIAGPRPEQAVPTKEEVPPDAS